MLMQQQTLDEARERVDLARQFVEFARFFSSDVIDAGRE